MKNKVKKMVLNVVVACACLLVPALAYAKEYSEYSVYIPKYPTFYSRTLVDRTGAYAYVDFKCTTIYPTTGGTDTYTKMRARVGDGNYTAISNAYSITEGDDYNHLYIWNGYLTNELVCVQVGGNSSSVDAYANIKYNPK